MAGIVSLQRNQPIVVNQQTVTGASAADVAYGPSWNGNQDAPTKNAVYDKIETLGSGTAIGGAVTSGTPGSVIFVGGTDAAPVFAQDNQDFFYDVTNNRLALFSSLGTELLTNPNFTGSASGWTVPAGWAHSANAVSHTSNGTGSLSQSASIPAFREHLLTYTVSGLTAGTVNVTLTMGVGSYTGPTRSANGTYAERIHLSFPATALNFVPSNTARLTIDNVSLRPLLGANVRANLAVGGQSIEGSWSNGTPGTTRAFTFSNDGSQTWTDYRFAGVLRAAIGADNQGQVNLYASGGSHFAFYGGNSGLTSNQLFAYLYPTAFVHSTGYGSFRDGVHAGGISANTSTLQTAGGTALKVKRVTANATLDNTATHWLADATGASACSGTPSVTACSTYTGSGQAACESHLPCVWFAGSSCSAFNNEFGMTSCNGTSGCSADTSPCSGAGDQASCEAQDDSYGGSCLWTNDPQSCSGFDESTCNGTSGCTANADECSNYSDGGGDGTACNAANGGSYCSYDSGTGVCSGGSFGFLSCSGTYDSYSCTGTYYTGNCSGTYGASCSGTASCAGYSSSGACNGEPGCTWTTTLNLTLPDGGTCPDRTYWIKNDTPLGSDVNIIPHAGQTIDKLATLTLANYGDAVHIAYFPQTEQCSQLPTQGACEAQSGCTATVSNCSWDSMGMTCSGHPSCTAPDQLTCEATTYYAGCSGTYTVARNWYVFGNS